MNLQDYFSDTRQQIGTVLTRLFDEETRAAASMAGTSAEILGQLGRYACSGKMLRGILGRLGADLFTWNNSKPTAIDSGLLKLCAALELFQAGLLVHDDIMDQDDLRRGKPTLHKSFESAEREMAAGEPFPKLSTLAQKAMREPDFRRLGEAKGICAGDIFFFEAWKLVAEADPELAARLSGRFSRELVDVCLAQISDVRFGSLDPFPSLGAVLEVYVYKTARYTITLPLCAGVEFAGRIDAVPALEAIGEPLGIVFQLQDDYLGLFGDEKELGKPVGSDLREGKKTPYMIALLPWLSSTEKASFFEIFGRADIGTNEIDFIRHLVEAHGVDAEIHRMIDSEIERTRTAVESFSRDVTGINPKAFRLLQDFVDYSIARKN